MRSDGEIFSNPSEEQIRNEKLIMLTDKEHEVVKAVPKEHRIEQLDKLRALEQRTKALEAAYQLKQHTLYGSKTVEKRLIERKRQRQARKAARNRR